MIPRAHCLKVARLAKWIANFGDVGNLACFFEGVTTSKSFLYFVRNTRPQYLQTEEIHNIKGLGVF